MNTSKKVTKQDGRNSDHDPKKTAQTRMSGPADPSKTKGPEAKEQKTKNVEATFGGAHNEKTLNAGEQRAKKNRDELRTAIEAKAKTRLF